MRPDFIWIMRGSQRRLVFLNLRPRFMPNELRKQLNITKDSTLSLREVSRHLKGFEERGLVRCLNPRDPYNKIYEITPKGKRTKDELPPQP